MYYDCVPLNSTFVLIHLLLFSNDLFYSTKKKTEKTKIKDKVRSYGKGINIKMLRILKSDVTE